MQKVRIQLCLEPNALTRLEGYRQEFMCKNYNDTIHLILKKLARMDFIMEQLEQKAKEAKEWKERAIQSKPMHNQNGIEKKVTNVPDVGNDTDLKLKSVENIKGTRKRKGGS